MADETTTPAPKKNVPAAPSSASPIAGLVADLLAPPKVLEAPPAPKREGPPTVAEHLEACLRECASERERGDVRFFHSGARTFNGWADEQQISADDYAKGVRAFAGLKFTSST